MRYTRQSGRRGSSGWDKSVPASSRSSPGPPGAASRSAWTWWAMSKPGSSDQRSSPSAQSRGRDATAKARDRIQARLEMATKLGQRRRAALEPHRPPDVQRGDRGVEIEERRVERTQAIRWSVGGRGDPCILAHQQVGCHGRPVRSDRSERSERHGPRPARLRSRRAASSSGRRTPRRSGRRVRAAGPGARAAPEGQEGCSGADPGSSPGNAPAVIPANPTAGASSSLRSGRPGPVSAPGRRG